MSAPKIYLSEVLGKITEIEEKSKTEINDITSFVTFILPFVQR